LPDHGWPPGFASSDADRDAVLVLAHLQTITPRELLALAREEGAAARCLAALRRGAGTIGDRGIADSVDVGAVRASLREAGARFVCWGDPDYPAPLRDLADPPGWLFVRGGSPAPLAVAVVGARNASPYGSDAATLVGAGLAAAGVAVVSGAARGIDSAAHRGALEVGGPTVAVLGSGIDVPYPTSSRGLIRRIAAEGVVVSEYPPGMKAERRRFPARNRIVAGLARAVVVVEGAEGSGSLITADFAVQIGRTVFAVPGPIDNPLSAVPHGLIRDGASIVTEPEDVLRDIGVLPVVGDRAEPEDLDPDERALFRSLSGAPATVDSLARAAGIASARALVVLSGLELRGLAAASGGRYRRAAQKRKEAQTSDDPRNAASAASAVTG